MERERQNQHHSPLKSLEPMSDSDREEHRERLRGLSESSGRIIDSIEAGNAEQFLQQHRQRGAQ